MKKLRKISYPHSFDKHLLKNKVRTEKKKFSPKIGFSGAGWIIFTSSCFRINKPLYELDKRHSMLSSADAASHCRTIETKMEGRRMYLGWHTSPHRERTIQYTVRQSGATLAPVPPSGDGHWT